MSRVAVIAIVLFASSPAFAEQPAAAPAPAPAPDAAGALARDAQSEYLLGHYQRALELFEKSYEQNPDPPMLFQIAQCHRKLGELRQAASAYRAFLRKVEPRSRAALRAEDLLDEVEDAIERTQRVPVAVPVPVPMPAPAPEPAPAAALPRAAMPEAQAAPQHTSHKTAFVLGGTAVVAVGAGSVLGLKSRNAGNDLTSTIHNQSDADSLAHNKKDFAIVADLCFALSAVLALSAAIAW